MQDRYNQESFINAPLGNNRIDFEERKKQGSDCILRIPPLIQGTLDDVTPLEEGSGDLNVYPAYEYISDSGKLISASGLQNLVQLNAPLSRGGGKTGGVCYIIDNHNHAFYCRYKSYLDGHLPRGSHLIHIDQHSDLSPLVKGGRGDLIMKEGSPLTPLAKRGRLETIASYTNEILDIASFIKPAKECGLISDYEMILTEFSLLNKEGLGGSSTSTMIPLNPPLQGGGAIVDIDLDFRAPEMSIERYDQTIQQVKKIIALPQVQCITIATSPTYINQERALEILRDILI